MPIRSQFDQRKHAKYKDQHGRAWWALVEKRTGDPCSNIMPTNWMAPVMPPQNYLKLDPETPGLIVIDYDQWERDLVAADRDWNRRCQEFGMQEYKEKFDPNAPFNVAILNKIGPRPHVPRVTTPPYEQPMPGAAALPVQAAKAGNLWALGLRGPKGETPKMPERLRAFYEKPTVEVATFANEFIEEDVEEEIPPPEPDTPEEEAEELPPFLKPAAQARSA